MAKTLEESSDVNVETQESASRAKTALSLVENQEFRDQILRTIGALGGSACACQVAYYLPKSRTVAEINPVLQSLVESGVLTKEKLRDDPRDKAEALSTLYKLRFPR